MTCKTVDAADAKARFQEMLEDVERGDLILVKINNRVVAEISPPRNRILGLHEGAVHCADDFDAELPESYWSGR